MTAALAPAARPNIGGPDRFTPRHVPFRAASAGAAAAAPARRLIVTGCGRIRAPSLCAVLDACLAPDAQRRAGAV